MVTVDTTSLGRLTTDREGGQLRGFRRLPVANAMVAA
jgi:hypothetical protein